MNDATIDMLFPLFNVFIGAYALYCAIKGKGQGYRSNCPPEVEESVNKTLRVFFWIMGPVMLTFGLLEVLIGVQNLGGMWFVFAECASITIAVIIYIIIYRVKYNRELKQQREQQKEQIRQQREQRKQAKKK